MEVMTLHCALYECVRKTITYRVQILDGQSPDLDDHRDICVVCAFVCVRVSVCVLDVSKNVPKLNNHHCRQKFENCVTSVKHCRRGQGKVKDYYLCAPRQLVKVKSKVSSFRKLSS